jgi:hypothetical protein
MYSAAVSCRVAHAGGGVNVVVKGPNTRVVVLEEACVEVISKPILMDGVADYRELRLTR